MSAKAAGRFSYLPKADPPKPAASKAESDGGLRSVPRGDGRMEQAREQLNVRVPTTLKRRALAKAALEGKNIGELVEELLYGYVSSNEAK